MRASGARISRPLFLIRVHGHHPEQPLGEEPLTEPPVLLLQAIEGPDTYLAGAGAMMTR
jgi:hypothetical protein